MKILEVNMESEVLDDQDSNNTEMSFREIEPEAENNGPFGQEHSHIRSPSVTSQTDLRDQEPEPVKGLGIGPLEDNLKEQSMD